VVWALPSRSKHSRVPEDSKSPTFPSVGLHPHTWPKWGCDTWCECSHTIDHLGTQLLWCPCGSECTTSHNAFWDSVAIIILKSGTHVQKEISHVVLCHTQQQRVDILISKYGFRTLMDIVSVDLIRTYMMQWTLMMITHVVMMVTQEKT